MGYVAHFEISRDICDITGIKKKQRWNGLSMHDVHSMCYNNSSLLYKCRGSDGDILRQQTDVRT
jgi:hypothetical protein